MCEGRRHLAAALAALGAVNGFRLVVPRLTNRQAVQDKQAGRQYRTGRQAGQYRQGRAVQAVQAACLSQGSTGNKASRSLRSQLCGYSSAFAQHQLYKKEFNQGHVDGSKSDTVARLQLVNFPPPYSSRLLPTNPLLLLVLYRHRRPAVNTPYIHQGYIRYRQKG